jgi:MFS family permease
MPGIAVRSSRAHLRSIMLAWVFGAGWAALVGGGPMVRFALAMGFQKDSPAWGLLSAVPFLAMFFQLAGSYWVEWTQRRKPIFFVANLIHRSSWIVIGLMPYVLLRWWPAAAVVSVLSMVLFQAILANMASPAYVGWMADVVPARHRGRFFGVRVQLGQAVVCGFSLVAGWLLGAAQDHRLLLAIPIPWRDFSDWPVLFSVPFGLTVLNLCAIFFCIAAVLGCTDILFFWNVPDRPARPLDRAPRPVELFVEPLRQKAFRRYLAFYLLLQIGCPGIGYYIWINVIDQLGVGDLGAQLLFMVIPPLGEVMIAPMWGRMIDRFGRRKVWRMTMLFPSILPLCWVFITPATWWLGFFIQLLGNIFWNGSEQCSFNKLLHLSSSNSGSSRYQALYALTLAVGGLASGLLFAGLTRATGGFHWDVGPFAFRYFAILFTLAAIFRSAAYFFLLPRVEPKEEVASG